MPVFDKLISSLDAFEQAVSSGKLPRRSVLTAQLESITKEIIILQNQRGLVAGSKSLLTKLSRLCADLINGLASPEIMSGKDFIIAVRDKFGPLNSGLTNLNKGGALSDSQKSQMRTLENDEDKSSVIADLMERSTPGKDGKMGPWHYGPTVVNGTDRKGQEAYEDVTYFLHTNFTYDQLKSFDLDKWNQLTYKDIFNRTDETTRKIKAELVKRAEDDYKALSESYKDVAKRLPRNIPNNGPFTAIKFPVVTVWQEVAASKNEFIMRNAGFKVTRVGSHFSILENQYLLCIDLDKAGIGESIVLKENHRARIKKTDGPLWDTAQNIVNTINARSPVKYAIASHSVVRNPLNARIALVWLITEHQRRALTETLHSREVDWDIPRHNSEPPKLSHREAPAHRFEKRPRND